MKITNELDIRRRKVDNKFVIDYNCNKTVIEAEDSIVEKLYKEMLNLSQTSRSLYWSSKIPDETKKYILDMFNAVDTEDETAAPALTGEELLKDAIQRMMNFFTEFQFEPNFRFLNTLSHALTCKGKNKAGKEYIAHYFELIDSTYKNDIIEKMKCAEFAKILTDFAKTAPAKTVNNRFKIYYGSQGTGKTTIAQKETDNRCIICNASMLPADLMEDFDFADGKATFRKSMLWDCMEKGLPIVFDEINLLPFDSLRFLQGLLDGKAEFNYKGNIVRINEGFQIIGTMNLTVNGMTYGLPEPLIDRCAEMKKFSLTAEDLMKAILA